MSLKVPDYTEYGIRDDLSSSATLLDDYDEYVDSIEFDQEYAPVGARSVALSADGSDIEQVTYDFDDPTGILFYKSVASQRTLLGSILPTGVAASGIGGVILRHGTGEIQVGVSGSGVGLGSQQALFADPTEANYLGFFVDVAGDYKGATSAVFAAKNDSAATAGGAQAFGMGSTGTFGIYWGSGAPTISAAQGSLYLRTDGSSTSTRAYINTDGSTTWTSITTAA